MLLKFAVGVRVGVLIACLRRLGLAEVIGSDMGRWCLRKSVFKRIGSARASQRRLASAQVALSGFRV